MNRSLKQIIGFSIVILLAGCKKDQYGGENIPPANGLVKIVFPAVYMDVTKVDSAVGIWVKDSVKQRISFERKGDRLQANAAKLVAGNGELTLQLFTSTKVDTLDLLWEKSLHVSMKQSSPIEVVAPSSASDMSWQPRVIFKDHRLKLYAFVGLRVDDPYFELRSADPKWKSLLVYRNYYDAFERPVGGGAWSCPTGCYDESGRMINLDYFNFLPSQIGSTMWQKAEVHVRFSEFWAMNRNFHLNYERQ